MFNRVSAITSVAACSLLLVSCTGGTASEVATPSSPASTSVAPSPSAASSSASPTPDPAPLSPPGPVADVRAKVVGSGPDAEIEVSFEAPAAMAGQAEPTSYLFEGDLSGRASLSPKTFSIEKSMLGKELTFTITSMSAEGDGEPVSASVSVPKDALELDLSGYKELDSREWAQVLKDPDSFIGETFVVYAQITQFDAATGTDSFRAETYYMNAGSDIYYEGENAFFTGDEDMLRKYVADDIVKIWVTSLGSFSYDTQAGGNTTVPLFMVDEIELLG